MSRISFRALIPGWILGLSVLIPSARAQFDSGSPLLGSPFQGPETYVSWAVRPIPSNIGSDGTSVLKITGTLAPDWKMYALDASLPSTEEVLSRPYGVTVSPGDSLIGVSWLGRVGQTAPKTGYDEIFEMELKWFYGEATFFAAVQSTDSLQQTLAVPLKVRFQICNDVLGVCLRPETVQLEALLSVDPTCVDCTASATDLALTEEVGLTATATSTASGIGIWPFLLLAIGAGLASLLTPCVFPMIPLTVSYFTKYGHSRKEAVRLALLYGSAIVITFTAIGIVMALLVGAAGALAIASNPVVNLFIAVVLVAFALSLLGFYEIRMPSGLLNWANTRGNEESGWVGVLFMGLTLTLVSFSCTAPFVGGLLAAAATGSWTFPLFGMVVYSATFALPFVLLALFPRALDRLPRSGAWMNSLKVVLGFVELAAAVKFFSNADLVWGIGALPRMIMGSLVAACLLLTGLYLLGWLRVGHGRLERPAVARAGLAVAFLAGGLLVLPGMLGRPLGFLDAYLPPHQDLDRKLLASIGIDHAAADFEEGWMVDDIEGAFTWAQERGVPVLVDFSGWTCTNCRDMEANVFP
ncbi:MAG: protein-disulfide reductase DsbD family protein, partial [Bacteroidetes bacterium]|nr:protein-disulfide reductase DsbD family protein [Bacteroidota bacterium]